MFFDETLLYVHASLPARHKTYDTPVPVDVGDVRVKGNLARRALAEFAQAHRREYLDVLPVEEALERFRRFDLRTSWDPFHDSTGPDTGSTWTEILRSDEMQTLATRGHDLFIAVFGDGKIAGMVRKLKPGTHLVMQAAGRRTRWPMHVPWGLMYRGDPDAEIDPEKFFGLSFRLEHGIAHGKRGLGDPAAATVGNILFWGGGPSGDEPAVAEAERQRAVFSGWTAPKQVFYPDYGTPGKLAQVISFLKCPEPEPVSVLYLYGHTETDTNRVHALRLGHEDEKPQIVSDVKLGRRKLAAQPLVFVNGCDSGNGSGGYRNRFAGTFRERGCAAYIGTEAAVPTVLASRIGMLFFALFYRQTVQDPVAAGEALSQVRRFLWEQYRNIGGLFYSYVDQYDLYLADGSELERRQLLQAGIVTLVERPLPFLAGAIQFPADSGADDQMEQTELA